MLPDSHYTPSDFGKPPVRILIAGGVTVDLLRPIRAVCDWPGSMQRTPVPEAAIDENSQPLADEAHVSATSNACEWEWAIHPVPHTTSVEFTPKRELRSSVTLTIGAHDHACSGARCPRLIRHEFTVDQGDYGVRAPSVARGGAGARPAWCCARPASRSRLR